MIPMQSATTQAARYSLRHPAEIKPYEVVPLQQTALPSAPLHRAGARPPQAAMSNIIQTRPHNQQTLVDKVGLGPIEQVNSRKGGCNVPHAYHQRSVGSHAL